MTEIMTASRQWATRPPEERFTNLPDMLAAAETYRKKCLTRGVANRDMTAMPVEGDHNGLIMSINGAPTIPTHFAFGQICSLVGAPAGYLRKLPSPLVADCVNYGFLKQRNAIDVGTMTHHTPDSPVAAGELVAATGPNYGRVWNDDVIRTLIEQFGDGISGAFTVPGEFGKAVDVTQDNTTLYRSDRDMFVFLADEKNRVTIPNRRDGKSGDLARGFFIYNSEVGSKTLGVETFLFDYACSNRIVWGATEHSVIKIRHTSSAPHRWIEDIAPALQAYATASAVGITEAIAAAQAAKIGREENDIDDFLRKRFNVSQTAAVKLAHSEEEGRPIETIWDAVTGATAYARGIKFQDDRVDIERVAGKMLEVAR